MSAADINNRQASHLVRRLLGVELLLQLLSALFCLLTDLLRSFQLSTRFPRRSRQPGLPLFGLGLVLVVRGL